MYVNQHIVHKATRKESSQPDVTGGNFNLLQMHVYDLICSFYHFRWRFYKETWPSDGCMVISIGFWIWILKYGWGIIHILLEVV